MGYLSLLDFGETRIDIAPPLYVVGGNVIYATSALRVIGGFKTHLGRVGEILLSNEELEICNSLRANGYRILYEPSARIGHVVDPIRVDQSWFRKRIFWQAVSDLLMKAKDPGDIDDLGNMFANANEPPYGEVMGPVNDTGEALPAHEFAKQLRRVYRLTISLSNGTSRFDSIPIERRD
jgi:hypothetical protein